MTDFDYEEESSVEPSAEPSVEPAPLQQLHDAEPYPYANVITTITEWVLESIRYPEDDTRRWECALHYFLLMRENHLLFARYPTIRVNTLAKITDIQAFLLEWDSFHEDNRPLLVLLSRVMNEVLIAIGRWGHFVSPHPSPLESVYAPAAEQADAQADAPVEPYAPSEFAEHTESARRKRSHGSAFAISS